MGEEADPRRSLEDLRRAFDADTALVVLMDSTGTRLVPTISVGFGRAASGLPPIPVGEGFAGRIAASGRPLVVRRIAELDGVSPAFLWHGIQSVVGVPLMREDTVIGVVHVGSMQVREFGPDDVERLTELTIGLADEVAMRRARDAQHAALTLQVGLLPSQIRAPQGLAMAGRYVPAEGEFGGDWYDVFVLPDARLAVVIGDVVGHGLWASIIMGRLRSALRAYALDHDDPAEVLRRLDRKICHFEPDALATVLLGTASPPYREWSFSSAGHPGPILRTPGTRPRQVELPTDRLLGVMPGAQRRTTRVLAPEGSMMCLFTDGLVERRPDATRPEADLVLANLERMATALAEGDDPDVACVRVLDALLEGQIAEDDIAVLTVSVRPVAARPSA